MLKHQTLVLTEAAVDDLTRKLIFALNRFHVGRVIRWETNLLAHCEQRLYSFFPPDPTVSKLSDPDPYLFILINLLKGIAALSL